MSRSAYFLFDFLLISSQKSINGIIISKYLTDLLILFFIKSLSFSAVAEEHPNPTKTYGIFEIQHLSESR
jgi:hypothetical protein